MAAAVVAHGALLVGGQGVEVGDDLLDRLVLPLGALEGAVGLVDVRLVVLVVMQTHGLLVDVRLQCRVVVGQGRNLVRHCRLLLGWSASSPKHIHPVPRSKCGHGGPVLPSPSRARCSLVPAGARAAIDVRRRPAVRRPWQRDRRVLRRASWPRRPRRRPACSCAGRCARTGAGVQPAVSAAPCVHGRAVAADDHDVPLTDVARPAADPRGRPARLASRPGAMPRRVRAARLLVTGVIEPDADNDGYGDETQDACPAEASLHVAPCTADIALDDVRARLRRRRPRHALRRDRRQPRAERRRRRDRHRRHPLRGAVRAHRGSRDVHPRRHRCAARCPPSRPARAACSPSCWRAPPRA